MGNVVINVNNQWRSEADQLGAAAGSAQPMITSGTIQMSNSYATNGDSGNLSGYFSQLPDSFVIGPSTNGYTVNFVTGGNLTVTKFAAYVGSGNTSNAPIQVVSTGNLTLEIAPFIAVGGQPATNQSFTTD